MKANHRAKSQTVRELSRKKQGYVGSRHPEEGLAVAGKLKAESKRSGRKRDQSNWSEK